MVSLIAEWWVHYAQFLSQVCKILDSEWLIPVEVLFTVFSGHDVPEDDCHAVPNTVIGLYELNTLTQIIIFFRFY